jgi:hypothetical protein
MSRIRAYASSFVAVSRRPFIPRKAISEARPIELLAPRAGGNVLTDRLTGGSVTRLRR